MKRKLVTIFLPTLLFLLFVAGVFESFAHCDTMDGPVIADAKEALKSGRVEHVLMWVQEKDEPEIKRAFERSMAIRRLSSEAQKLADIYFFETLVRIHRAGEGAPYTGIKSAGAQLEPAIAQADRAVETGSIEPLIKQTIGDIGEAIHERFHQLMEKKKYAKESVSSGREYVASYVEFIHYVERVNAGAKIGSEQHGASLAHEGEPSHVHKDKSHEHKEH